MFGINLSRSGFRVTAAILQAEIDAHNAQYRNPHLALVQGNGSACLVWHKFQDGERETGFQVIARGTKRELYSALRVAYALRWDDYYG